MQKREIIAAALLLCLAMLLAACGGAKTPPEPISVERAMATLEENYGSKVCVRGYPVAFFYSYTYSGGKVYSIFFSDSAEDYYGEIETTEEVRDDWLEVVVKEKNPLWQTVKGFFGAAGETQEVQMLLKCVKSQISGIYYDFVKFQ